jgi:predicted amidohydrolase YtcJ
VANEQARTEPLLLHSGRIFTASERAPWAEAVAIVGSRIEAVGTSDDLRDRFPYGRIVDLDGRAVVPGFIDAHNHFLATGESMASVDVRYPRVASPDDLVRVLSEVARRTPAGERISAFGFDDAKYGRAPTRWDLDRATTEHPVAVHHVSGHHVLVNSRLLVDVGVGDYTPDPPGGRLAHDASGHVTGLFLDGAMNLVLPVAVEIGSHGPNFHTAAPEAELLAAVERAGRAFLEAGLTAVCDAQVTSRELGAYSEARRLGRLPVRTVCMPLSHQLEAYRSLGLAGPFGDDRLRIGAMKLYADGSLIGGTAAFSEPYGENGEFEGLLYHDPDELEELIVAAHLDGWQVGVHVQGDRAMSLVLDAIETAVEREPREHRHRLEHAGYPTPELLARIAADSVITVNQPTYLVDSGDEFLVRLRDRAHGLQPLRSELMAGIPMVLSSDSDVASYRPLETIQAAVTRRTMGGAPIGPGEALTVEEAVRAHTIMAAYALFAEREMGSIEAAKLADVAVIDGDLFATPRDEIRELEIWMTVLDGRIVHARDETIGP